MSIRETEKFQRGHNGELTAARYFQGRGWFVIPSYDYSGDDGNKAPKMQGLRDGFVIPDLDICKDGLRVWVEVKTKAEPTLHRKSGTYEHGIPLRHYNHYRRVQAETGCDVWLVVFEEGAGFLLGRKLDDLEPNKRVYDGNKMSRGGMVFWPRSEFRQLHRFPVPATEAA